MYSQPCCAVVFLILRWIGMRHCNPQVLYFCPASRTLACSRSPSIFGHRLLNNHLSPMTCAEIRPYMYETLMSLVGVHAQVCSVSESLLDRALFTLVEELASEALRCFRQVKRFGMGGMLRVCSFFTVLILPSPRGPLDGRCALGHLIMGDTAANCFLFHDRLPSKSNSCNRRLGDMCPLRRLRHYPIFILASLKHTPGDLGMKICKQI